MGAAIATAALERGAQVTVVAANLEVPLPDGAEVVHVESTAELRAALLRRPTGPTAPPASTRSSWPRPSPTSGRPRPPTRSSNAGAGLTLQLEPTPDVLAQIARIVRGTDSNGEATAQAVLPRPYLVGFAAETGSLERARREGPAQGRRPARRQRCRGGRFGFGTETNRVSILAPTASGTTCRC